MQIPLDEEFRSICHAIVAENRSDEEWAEIEADDYFQEESYTGGYDAIEEAFTFSFYPPEGGELWFQLTLREVERVAAGELHSLEARPAE